MYTTSNNIVGSAGRIKKKRKNTPELDQFVERAYVASNLDLTYSPAVTTSYLAGVPGDTHVGIGCEVQDV